MAWESYVYQYGVMLAVFILGMVLCWKQGDVGFSSGRRRRNLLLLVGGMLFFMVLQGFLQFMGPKNPDQVHSTPMDRFFVRVFIPEGPPRETEAGWKQAMTIEGTWFHCPSGQRQTAYRMQQDIDSGPPGEAFAKMCPIFHAPLTDWHDELLDHFTEHGFCFSEVKPKDCLPACREYEPDRVEACQEACAQRCNAQYLKIFRGKVD
jgi:hypothetical protein